MKNFGRSSSLELSVALKMAEEEHNKIFLITFHDPIWKYTDEYPYIK